MDGKQKEYRPLTIPTVEWDKKILTNQFGELIAQPLEPGFGITLGNALRRVLLGGIEGASVTSVVIKGVNNEFSSLPGVVEDIMQILLNIKGIVVKNKTGLPGKMHLKVSSESTVTVADITSDNHLELVNTDHILARLASGGELDITFFVETGRGYQPANWPLGTMLQEDGRIYLDALFSPVKKVMFDVKKTRIGKNIDYDKLILTITTDGSETPLDVINYAVSLLRTQFENFLVDEEIPFNDISLKALVEKDEVSKEEEKVVLKGIPSEVLLKPIEELELSVRAHNCLVNAGVKRFIDLVNLSEEESLKIKNFGRKSLNEVNESLKTFGLSLGMNIKNDLASHAVE